jgi:SAM-dependent methyltransferase
MSSLAVRRLGTELLDDPLTDSGLVAESLRNIAQSNRWFGGTAAFCFGLRRAVRGTSPGARLTLLDVGSGLGDLPRAGVRWAGRRGIQLVPIGLDRHPVAARLARSRGLPMVLGCAGAPPIAEKSVDVVSVSMLAHHFEPDSVVELLRACDRIARRAVVVTDLRRAGLAVIAFRWGARLLRFDPVTVADGMTSIRRGFTAAELTALLARAGVAGQVTRRPGWRLVATWTPRVP